MPTRFPFSKTEGKLTVKVRQAVKVRQEVALDYLHSAVSSNLLRAKNTCHIANRWLQASQPDDKLLKVAHHYFLTPRAKIDDADLATIRTVVNKVWTGLSGDVTTVLCAKTIQLSPHRGLVEWQIWWCFAGESSSQAASSSRRSANCRIFCLVGRPDRASCISPCNTSRCNALRLS